MSEDRKREQRIQEGYTPSTTKRGYKPGARKPTGVVPEFSPPPEGSGAPSGGESESQPTSDSSGDSKSGGDKE